MLGRTSGSGFRFLHDEISGGLFAVSHLKTLAAYAGDCVNVNSIDYGFLNNIVDMAAIDAANMVDRNASPYYDQFGLNDIFSAISNPFYDKSENEFPNCFNSTYRETTVAGALASLQSNDPFTAIQVVKHNTGTYATQEWMLSFESTSQMRLMWQSNSLRLLVNGGTSLIYDVSGLNNANLKMIVADYDGSLTSAGLTLYQNDMITPLSGSASGSGGAASAFFGALGVSGRANNAVGRYNGFIYETHIFDKVLSQAERETAKAILQQYYAIP
jgi:hypothetical protein